MNLKVYEKTRYQNIYRHKKNKNYVISISKPVKTSISKIDGKRITSTEEALKIRDNVTIKLQKGLESSHKEQFDDVWDKYMFWCKNIDKQAYNTLIKKDKLYNKFFKHKITKILPKITKSYISEFIDELDTTLKQKNHIIKELKIFFNWCKKSEQQYIIQNPLDDVSKYKVPKPDMKFWTPEELNKFLETVKSDFNSPQKKLQFKSHMIYTLSIIGFSLGDRIGETRALSFNSIDYNKKLIKILHSINYDTRSTNFVNQTKTYESERIIDVSSKVINIIDDYKNFLINEMGYNVKETDLIFTNYTTMKPYSDTNLRAHFNYYIGKAKVPKIRMYDLRHTYASTMMSEEKNPYLFSERMGHKTIKTTIDVYGHLSNQVKKEVAKITDKYF